MPVRVPEVEATYSLSPLQRGMLFDALSAPGSGVDVEQMVVDLPEALDVPSFLEAWRRVVARHAVLRTGFRWEDTEVPLQEVRARVEPEIAEEDWRELPECEREARFRELLRADRERGFDLSVAPLMRLALFRPGAAEYRLVWTFHHALLDGRAMTVVLRELFTLYEALREGRDLPLPAPRPYAEYIAWLERQDSGPARAFWSGLLEGFTAATPLPRREAAGEAEGEPYAEQEAVFPRETAAALEEVARAHGLTLNTLVQGAWAVLLSRYGGRTDVVFGSVRACRRSSVEGADSIVGLLINTLPVRVRAPGEAPLLKVLREIRAQSLAVRPHEHTPLAEIQAWSEVPPGSPLFESAVNFQKEPFDAALRAQGGAWARRRFRIVRQPSIPLSVAVYGKPVLRARIGYDARAFEAELIARMLGHLGCLLEGIAAGPGRRISELPMLTGTERRQLLEEWSATAHEHRAECIHTLFAAQAARTPEWAAVEHEGEALTYAELDRRANRLAHRLRARGVGPEARVGVCLGPGPQLVAALLAVLKAGGAYVPLDPSYPRERLAYVLSDSGAAVLLTRGEVLAELAAEGVEVLRLDAEEEHLAREPEHAPGVEVSPESLAYVVYTSGSTGRPKGVGVEHAAAAAHLLGFAREMGVGPADRVLQFAPAGFDVALEQVLVPLVSGAALVLRGAEPWAPEEFPARARALGVTVANLSPAYWQEVARAARGETLPELRLLLVGADAMPSATVRRWREAVSTPARLLNAYGPTEAVVTATVYPLPEDYPGAYTGAVVPIGRPLPGRAAYVLDAAGELAPVGIPGELYLGGPLLARGYPGRPGLTAERWVPDPFAGGGARMYRTGDRVRRRADGELEFLGRVDRQVKIRGFRIEPGEVEATLLRHPAVRQAVVVADGERRLVGYVVPAEGAPPAGKALRSWLGERLPEHMVPTVFVVLDALPLTPGGKVDRRALPTPGREAAEAHVAPRTPTEEILAGIWAEVLGRGRVGPGAHFFELGGHSLLAMRVASRVREAFGVALPPRALFEHPTPAELAVRVDAGRAEGAEGSRPLRPAPRGGALPLSHAQERLWLIDRLEPGSAAYGIPILLRLSGPLEVEALRRALEVVVARHESLRTTFPVAGDGPVQAVAPPAALPLPVADLRGHPEVEALRRARDFAERPFDLAAGPLFRGALLRLDGGRHLLALAVHHAVFDGWSLEVLFRELGALYRAFSRGEPSPLPAPALQYADYAVWQREWLRGGVLERQAAWWRERLAGAPPLLELPTDRPRPPRSGGRRLTCAFALPDALAAELRALSRRAGATLFMTLLAAWQVLLARYGGADDVLVGTPAAGRDRVELEGLIGFFVNTLVLRADLSDDPAFRTLLARVRETTLDAYQNADVPFERLVEELQVERSLAHTPLFQVVFTLEAARAPLELGEVRAESLPVEGGTAKFDLVLRMVDDGVRLSGELAYRAELFEAETIERLAGHFRTLLRAVAATPGARVSTLSLLDEEERSRVLREWSAGAAGHDAPRPVHELFEAQAARTPERVAVSFGGEEVRYAELEARANRLAHHLRARGVGPEVPVGVCLERSPELVVTLLAVLKAGGAYLPLDPAEPRDRLAYVLRDTGARLLVTRERFLPALPALPVPAGEVVLVDAHAERIARASAQPPRVGVEGEGLACVMYTSGSTGRPKGVMVPHRGIVRLAREAGYVSLTPGEVVLQLAPASFDASTFEIWGALLNGARLALFAAHTPSLEELGSFVREQGVSTLWLTAGLFHALVEEHPEALRGVRQLLAGGDVLSVPHVRRAWELLPGCRIVNGYGPTEGTTFTCCHTVVEADLGRASIPLGGPIGGRRVYVLDAALEPSPVGVPGELFIGGEGVARGYLGRPALTAERWIPDPFGGAGERLYRSGDRARWLGTGELEFLGRVDRQVKVRGFRVVPGEVETALLEHAGVGQAVVVARADAAGGKRLVAYVSPAAGGRAPGTEELRAHLAGRLPEHMVPSAVVVLDAFPLTPNGKVDRRALPEPGHGSGEGYVAPRTPTEELLAGIWVAVLGVERVGVHDHFFTLGGHSLLATRVVSRVREAFGAELPLRALFEAQTVGALAGRVEALRGGGSGAQAPPLVPVPRDRPLPLSFAQQRLWFLDRMEPGSAGYNVPLALRLAGKLERGALRRALAEVVRRHEALRTRFPEVDGEPVQEVAPPGPPRLPLVDLSALPEEEREREVRRRAGADALSPFDLQRGPLLRAALLCAGAEEHVLLLCMHHVVSDGWSLEVLTRELSVLYARYAQQREVSLPELPVQYADYAVWQRRRLTGELLEGQVAWWRERLAGAPPLLALPTDRPRPAVRSERGGSVEVALPAELAGALRETARGGGATLFMVLLAGWQALLSKYSGEEEVVVGSPVAGRTHRELEGLIGFFVNTLALRTDLSGEPSFRSLLARVREATLGAYQHQEVPFERLVEELAPERSLAHTPLFQVVFALQNAPREALALPGLTLAPLPQESAGAKFDLTLALAEEEGGIRGKIGYGAALFDASTVERMAGHFRVLLERAVAAPGAPLPEISLLTEEERVQVVDGWNDTRLEHPRARLVHQLFSALAAGSPGAPAVVCEGEAVAYAELDRRSARLARRLAELGVGLEVRVAVYLERSPELVVSLLAVLRAGGVYVPLDPAYPAERLARVLRDSGARVLVTLSELLGRASTADIATVCLDTERGALAAAPPEPPAVELHPESLAYVAYTSGSTGEPKGVAVTHGGLLNLVCWHLDAFALTPADRTTLVAGVGFDASAWELWPSLAAGASLHVPPEEVRLSPERLRDWLVETGATLSFLPTPLAEAVLALEWSAEAALRAILTGGDALRAPPRPGLPFALVNNYGPTECTVVATSGVVPPRERPGAAPSIGRPIANTRTYVLDAASGPVPVGVPGELYVGGDGVARGYLGRPALTAERWTPDPFSPVPGARMYRTGDRVRWLASGELEFLGRVDRQVKVRGFRIEPGEVEAVLAEHPRVREAAVVAREDAPGDRRLVGYYAGEASPDELREHLRGRLPEHMVPAAFVLLDALPLTPSGKLDRRALPAPEGAGTGAYVAPRTALEQVLAESWGEVLGVGRVGVRDRFFDLGGHSLKATQVVSRLKALKLEVPVRLLFQAPTVEEMARALVAREPTPGRTERVAALMLRLRSLSPEDRRNLLAGRREAGK